MQIQRKFAGFMDIKGLKRPLGLEIDGGNEKLALYYRMKVKSTVVGDAIDRLQTKLGRFCQRNPAHFSICCLS